MVEEIAEYCTCRSRPVARGEDGRSALLDDIEENAQDSSPAMHTCLL